MSTKNISEDNYARITLRIPKDLHAYLQDEAENKSRSMNAEIIDRLSGTGVDVQELQARIRLAEGHNRSVLKTIIGQMISFLSAENRTIEAERDLLISLLREQAKLD